MKPHKEEHNYISATMRTNRNNLKKNLPTVNRIHVFLMNIRLYIRKDHDRLQIISIKDKKATLMKETAKIIGGQPDGSVGRGTHYPV